jgi:hypothetical protein
VARTRTTGRRGAGRGAQDSGVHRWGGSSDGWQRQVWGPAVPVWKGEERISSNLGMAKLGGRSPEKGKTTAALGKIRHEGEASDCRRQRFGRGNGGEGGGAREGGGEELVMGERTRGSVTYERLGRRRGREGKRGRTGGSGRGGATWRRGGRGAWPRLAGGAPTKSRPAVTRVRVRVGRPEKKTGWPSPDE